MRDYGLTNVAPYSTAPAVGVDGDLYWNVAEKALYGSDGVAWNKVGGTPMNGLPTGGTAGAFLAKLSATDYAAQWDPNRYWSIGGSNTTLTPTDATKALAVPGPTAAGADQSVFRLGSRTQKLRVNAFPAVDWAGLTLNTFYDGAQWARSDTAKTGWRTVLRTDIDQVAVEYVSAAGVERQPLSIDGAGVTEGRVNLNFPTANSGYDVLTGKYGTVTCRAHFVKGSTGQVGVCSNGGWTGVVDDTAQPYWAMLLADGDRFTVKRAAAGVGIPSAVTFLELTSGGALTCPPGQIKAGGVGGVGAAYLNPGDASTLPGYLGIVHPNGTRVAYIGYNSANRTIWQCEAGWGMAFATGNGSFDFYGGDSTFWMRGTNRSSVWFKNQAFVHYCDADNMIRCWGNVWGDFFQCSNTNPPYINWAAETCNRRAHRVRVDIFYGSPFSFNLTEAHESVIANVDGGNIYLYLPPAASISGRMYSITVWRGGGGSQICRVLGSGSDTIQGSASIDLNGNYAKTVLVCVNYGYAWFRVM